MFKYGIVSEVKSGFAKVQFEDDEIVSDWMPVLVRKSKSDKESWQLEISEHVVCLLDEHCEEGVVLGAIASEADAPDDGEGEGKFRKKFSDGTEIEYDKNSGKLKVDVQGELEAVTTGNVTIEAGGDLVATSATSATIEAPSISAKATTSAELEAPNISLSGNVSVSGSLSAASITTTGGGAITASGDMIVTGNLTATGDVMGGGKSLSLHIHTASPSGGPTSPPV